MSGTVSYQAADGVARLTIDREDRRNAINPEVVAGLADGLTKAEGDASINAFGFVAACMRSATAFPIAPFPSTDTLSSSDARPRGRSGVRRNDVAPSRGAHR